MTTVSSSLATDRQTEEYQQGRVLLHLHSGERLRHGQPKQIDILCGEGNFLVQGLNVRIVKMETVVGKFLRNLEIKKCRLQFEEIAEEQSSGIETIVAGACLQ